MINGLSRLRSMLGSVPMRRNVRTVKRGRLQAISPNSDLVSADARETLEARRYACVCSVIVDRAGRGSGFLIAEDLVMTNYHVVFDEEANGFFEPSRIKIRFNFFTDDQYENDEHDWVALPEDANEAFIAYSPPASIDLEGISENERDYLDATDPALPVPLLDYAILRLTSPIGKEAGRTSLGLEVRPLGWIALASALDFGQRLVVFQFPERVRANRGFSQQPQQTSRSTHAVPVANGLRAKYDASTRHGSSGSPVFDDIKLVGLHNAGQDLNNTANNRFVPIDRILDDLASRFPPLHAQLTNDRPPPIAAQQTDATADLSERVKRAIYERVKAAETLIDREAQNDVIQAKLRTPDTIIHVNHIVCQEKGDEIELFVDRIKVGAAQIEADTPNFIERYLCGSKAAEGDALAWKPAGMYWPPPNTAPEEARTRFRTALAARRYASRTLIVLQSSDLGKRSPEEEHVYMKILGEECAEYVKTTQTPPAKAWQALQALVVHKIPSGIQIDLSTMVPLWTEPPPPHCGASLLLPRVTRNDIEGWRVDVNEAWKKSNCTIEFPAELDPGAEFSMTQVIDMLKSTITNAAIALMSDEGENTP